MKRLALALLLVLAGAKYASMTAAGGYEIHSSAKDPRGYWTVKVSFPDQPAPIDRTRSYTKQVRVKLPETCWMYQIDTFNGLDRGDIVEMDTFVYDQYGRVLYQRSLHKETLGIFDSFEPRKVDAVTRNIQIHMHAHVTDPDEPARAHWTVHLWCAPI
jgi:hypothetical protein